HQHEQDLNVSMPASLLDEQNAVVHHMPWMAIALVAHCIAMVVAAFIVFALPEPTRAEVLSADVAQEIVPPIPDEPLQDKVEFPEDAPQVEDPTLQPVI